MTWKDDLNFGLSAFGIRIPDTFSLDALAPKLANSPLRNSASLVATSAALFLMAERGHNPKVNDIYDAMIYCSTCLSVGYADIFPRTPVGKLIGTLLMTIGPSLSARGLDGGPDAGQAAEIAKRDAMQAEVVGTLKAILAKMETAASSDMIAGDDRRAATSAS